MSSPGVCDGALLGCSCGTSFSTLQLHRRGMGTDTKLSFATVADARPLTNVQPFGSCLSAAHPMAQSGAAPCVPQTPSLWELRAPAVRYQQLAALRGDATLQCEYGGKISVVKAGQLSTQVREGGV